LEWSNHFWYKEWNLTPSHYSKRCVWQTNNSGNFKTAKSQRLQKQICRGLRRSWRHKKLRRRCERLLRKNSQCSSRFFCIKWHKLITRRFISFWTNSWNYNANKAYTFEVIASQYHYWITHIESTVSTRRVTDPWLHLVMHSIHIKRGTKSSLHPQHVDIISLSLSSENSPTTGSFHLALIHQLTSVSKLMIIQLWHWHSSHNQLLLIQ
jgi:hypothetical protein